MIQTVAENNLGTHVEAVVLKSGQKTVRRFRPVILFEHSDDLFNVESDAYDKKNLLKTYFEDMNYRVLYVSQYGSGLLA
jgi:hypothetical protein